MSTSKKLPYFASFLFALITGLSFFFVKITLSESTPLIILAHRFGLAFISLYLIKKLGFLSISLSWHDLLKLLPVAIFFPLLFFSLQFFALKEISVSEAGILQGSIPVSTLILATLFLKEKATKHTLFYLFLTVFGIGYIFWHTSDGETKTTLLGVILMLFSTFANSAYNVLIRKKSKDYTPLEITYAMLFIACFAFNFLAFFEISLFSEKGYLDYLLPLSQANYLLSLFYLAILASIMTAILSSYALTYLEASKVSVFGNLATLITILSGILFLDEHLYYYHIIGTILIIVGVLGTSYAKK